MLLFYWIRNRLNSYCNICCSHLQFFSKITNSWSFTTCLVFKIIHVVYDRKFDLFEYQLYESMFSFLSTVVNAWLMSEYAEDSNFVRYSLNFFACTSQQQCWYARRVRVSFVQSPPIPDPSSKISFLRIFFCRVTNARFLQIFHSVNSDGNREKVRGDKSSKSRTFRKDL